MNRRRASSLTGAFLFAFVLASSAPSVADACSCVPQTIESAWFDSTDTFVADVRRVRVGARQQVYEVEVKHAYKGCLTNGEIVNVVTPIDSAACGVALTVGSEVILTATATPQGTYAISLCGVNKATAQLTVDERAFLSGRLVVCQDRGTEICADGTQPVVCVIDPCTVETCAVPSTCFANYCGGCNAEFWDAQGFPVCMP